MSAHFSKFSLNTYSWAPYFAAHVPDEYPLSPVLQKSRSFRRLPPNLKQLAILAKRWAERSRPGDIDPEISRYYDAAGNELDPDTRRPLTDAQINSQWRPDAELDKFRVKDIPIPEGGFPDPETWQPEPLTASEEGGDEEPTKADVLRDIGSHGRQRVAQEYGVSGVLLAGLKTDEDLAQFILKKRGQ